ncbi:hypothetical protein BBK82_19365 [Lentzea guizhouensis]|uniref:Uncharacterized protein n=1 Tax=Lentzea guizhouensis TaxID=1586287 RepID=A0A1B2HJK2_9PSEU|nr:hypothetical protein BBK82_19365 [Lentzea guizhouensis]
MVGAGGHREHAVVAADGGGDLGGEPGRVADAGGRSRRWCAGAPTDRAGGQAGWASCWSERQGRRPSSTSRTATTSRAASSGGEGGSEGGLHNRRVRGRGTKAASGAVGSAPAGGS